METDRLPPFEAMLEDIDLSKETPEPIIEETRIINFGGARLSIPIEPDKIGWSRNRSDNDNPYGKARFCNCGVKLNYLNSSNRCYPCRRKAIFNDDTSSNEQTCNKPVLCDDRMLRKLAKLICDYSKTSEVDLLILLKKDVATMNARHLMIYILSKYFRLGDRQIRIKMGIGCANVRSAYDKAKRLVAEDNKIDLLLEKVNKLIKLGIFAR